jgi:hypothetical protein
MPYPEPDWNCGVVESRQEDTDVFRLGVLLLVGALQLVSGESKADNLDWRTYRNGRIGITLRYPQGLFEHTRGTSERDGDLFQSRDARAKLLVGSFGNWNGETPRSYQKVLAQLSYPGFAIDYAPRGATWSVLSGEKDGLMFYEKAIFTCNNRRINSFAMVYPVGERSLYDPIIETMEDSFRVTADVCR